MSYKLSFAHIIDRMMEQRRGYGMMEQAHDFACKIETGKIDTRQTQQGRSETDRRIRSACLMIEMSGFLLGGIVMNKKKVVMTKVPVIDLKATGQNIAKLRADGEPV